MRVSHRRDWHRGRGWHRVMPAGLSIVFGLALALAVCAPRPDLGMGIPTVSAASGSALYQQGQQHYNTGDYLGAARLYEQALDAGYTKPAVYYKLGLAFRHLKQWDGVVWAMQTLRSVSPSYASSHSLVATDLAQAQAQGGTNHGRPAPSTGGAGTSGTSTTGSAGPGPGAPSDREVAAALRQSDAYVSPAMNIGSGGAATLESDAQSLRQQGTTTKYAIIPAVPPPYTTLRQFTDALFTTLGLKHAVLVVADRQGVRAYSDRVSASDLEALINASVPLFVQGTYVTGAENLAHSIVAKADAADSAARNGRIILIVVVVLIIVVVLALYIVTRWRRWQVRYREAMAWRDAVANLENELSFDAQYVATGDPKQAAFLAGAEYYGKASTALDRLGKQSPLSIAFGGGAHFRQLGEARLNLQEAEGRMRQAGATGAGIGAPGRATPVRQGERAAQMSQRQAYRDDNPVAPTPAQAACFFCGRPLDPATAEAVFVPIGSQQRRVLVCAEHGTAVRSGQRPPVRVYQSPSLGRQVPWWAAPDYNPYNDYDPYYYRRGGLGWGDLFLYNALFNRPMSNIIFVDDDRWDNNLWDDRWSGSGGDYNSVAGASYGSPVFDAGSFDSGGRDMPSGSEFAPGDAGSFDLGGDRS